MVEKEITLDNLEDSFFGEEDLFNGKIFKDDELMQDIALEDSEESDD